MTKILLMNIPSALFPTDYPLVAISRVIESIDPSLNCEVSFLNLDYYRMTFEEIKSRIQSFSPQIIGFSAILTPTYVYVKKLSNFIKEHYPGIIQVLGGEMTVMANIILTKTGIDFCCIGESEPTFSNLIRRLQQEDFKITNMQNYTDIKGLVFRLNGTSHFTGYEEKYTENSLKQFNYKLISQFTDIDHYFQKLPGQHFRMRISADKMQNFVAQLYPHNRNKRMATVFASKGCVSRCTFCSRFLKGYRVNEVDSVINYIENLKKDFDVGMILFSEENFGSSIKSTAKLVEYLKNSGLNWAATAIRAKTLTKEAVKDWREAGCVHILAGLESASQKILEVMEKRTTVQDNLDFLRNCHKNRIFTAVGMVIGMPGETEETIQESIDNFATVLSDNIRMPFEMYVNYVQAIPGTPIYEYARRCGLIGNSLEGEEKYIESLYDINANEIDHYLNFTDYEKEEVAYWQPYIRLELLAAYIKRHGYINVLKYNKSKKFRYALIYILFPKLLRRILLKYLIIVRYYGIIGLVQCIYKALLRQRTKRFEHINISVRKLNKEIPLFVREDDLSTAILREGR